MPTTALQQLIDRVSQLSRERSGAGTHSARQRHIVATHLEERLLFSAVPVALATLSTTDNISAFDAVHGDADSLLTSLDGGRLVDGWGSHGDELGAPLHLLDGAAFDVSMPRKDDASSVIHRTYQGYEELLGQSAEDGDQWSFALESAAEKCATESADATDSAKQLVFIGGDVDGYEQLVEALRDNRGASQVEVHVLASDQDGVDQISKVLSEHSNVAALHILTHGGEGRVLLGDVQLSLASLSRFEEQIAGWSEHLAVGSDVLIYGCDVAATDDGRALTEQLSQLTGADVAASDDLTGHNSVGGDWDLEFTVGDVGTSVVVGLGQQQSWIVSLATIDVTTDQDVSDGDVSSIGALLADKGADNKVSLREAIEAVNNTGGGTHTIAFNISGGGVHTIELNSVLPEIATSVIIDGYTQGLTQENTLNVGTDAQLLIQLDGGNLGNNDHGLVISGDNVTIRGLIIGDFGGAGIYVHDADNAVVEGNFIGVNATGTSKDGNDYGVLLERATNAAIGGTTNAARNVISGNKYGVIVADMSWGNVVEGNLIGTSASGSSDLGNDNDGINVRDGAHDNTIGGTVAGAGNVISGTGILLVGDGVDIEATAGTGNRIQGNLIGLNANGTAGMYNAGRGISVEASGTLIGGTTAAARNVVSRNGGVGIQIANTDNITVIGNYVGSDISGNIDEGNLLGIYVDNSHDITIGGSTAAERNVVVGNTIRGVHITGSDSYNVTVAGNYIGVGADGSTDVGNSSSGIRLANGAHDITIGGATAAEGNVIANNGSDGITIDSDVGANFSLRNNTYTNNSGLGIDLGASGVTNNSNSDNWQDFPVLLGVHTSGSQTRFVGTVTGAASETVTVYFYLSASTDPSGYGEGDELVGSTDVVLNAFGTGTFSTTFAVDGSGRFASAIAHGTSGTSEFSSSAPIAANAPVVSLDDDGSSGATPGNYRASFSIGGAAVSIVDIDASITDSDSTHLGSLTVTITNLMDAGSEFLSATSSHPSINISYDAGAGVLTATGNASVAQYLTTLATLTYQNTSGSPDTIDRIITVVANDGTNSGSPALATVTFDANAAPTVTGPLTATDNEDGGTLSIDLLDGASDVDGDTLTPIGVTLTSGDDRGVSITGATVDVDLAQYGSLSVGESEVIVYDYTISDGNGGNVAQTLTITIEGRNDNPAVTGAVTATRHENAAVFNVDLLAGANDGDSSDTLNVVGLTLVSGDDSGVTIVGNSLQVDPTQYNYLSVGQFEEIQYSYDVSDGNGGSVAQTATIRINGRNDAPVVTASISATSNEDAVGFTVNLLTNATDPDQADTLSVAGLTLTGGDDRGITVVGNALVVDP
ncbi:MAG: DUF4347 domain-containing protein, partial [Planctomycetales bacterium]|nr:DUF4347 domain-containing protein [Planctomycetales bacterium]